MKNRIMAASAALALMVAPATLFSTSALAQNGGNSQIAKMCNGGLASVLGISIGTCMNVMRDSDAVGICKLLKDTDLLHVFGYVNQGQCIGALR